MNQKCLAALGGSGGKTGWRCLFGATAAQYVQTPLFVLNSKFDTWQEKAIIGVNCSVAACPANEQVFWGAYGKKMVAAAASLPAQHGAFVTNCPSHCQTGTASDWQKRTINGKVEGAAFTEWYLDQQAGGKKVFKYVEDCDEVLHAAKSVPRRLFRPPRSRHWHRSRKRLRCMKCKSSSSGCESNR